MRLSAALALAVLLAGHTVASADGARPPANDRRQDATSINALPFQDNLDAAGATSETDEPASCFEHSGASVWYRFSPAEDVAIDISTVGSDYSTTLDVLETVQGAAVGCDDYGAGGYSTSAGDSRLQVKLHGGATYLIRVAERIGSIEPGQRLRLSVRVVEPFTASQTFNPLVELVFGHQLYIRQRSDCNEQSQGVMSYRVTQGAGPLAAVATDDKYFTYCTPDVPASLDPLSYDGYTILGVEADTGTFRPGPATITAQLRTCGYGRYAECVDHSATAQLVIRPRP